MIDAKIGAVTRAHYARVRQRIYKEIKDSGVRGLPDSAFAASYGDLANIEGLRQLIAAGKIEAHKSYRGDRTFFDTVYVASSTKERGSKTPS